MEKYSYLFLGLSLLAAWAVAVIVRKDLFRKSVKLGIIGGFAGVLAEFFYFRDYWRPPTTLGVGKISPEDFIFGFAISALSLVVYPVLARANFIPSDKPKRRKMYGVFIVAAVVALLIFSVLLHMNSIFVTYGIFLSLAVITLFERRDLIRPAFYSTAVITVLVFGIYTILFVIVSPDFWHKYWLLLGTKWGVMLLGGIPLTEILWYVSCVMFTSAVYPYVSGKTLVVRNSPPDSKG